MFGIFKIIDLNAVWEGNVEAISHFVLWFRSCTSQHCNLHANLIYIILTVSLTGPANILRLINILNIFDWIFMEVWLLCSFEKYLKINLTYGNMMLFLALWFWPLPLVDFIPRLPPIRGYLVSLTQPHIRESMFAHPSAYLPKWRCQAQRAFKCKA